MLYGVTARGTAYSAFKDLKLPVAGKTGTTQDYRDAWFMSYTPGVVVAVWVGRDDFKPIPGNLSGSRAAAPIAKSVYAAALKQGLLNSEGHRPDQTEMKPWPPTLLDMNGRGARPQTGYVAADPFKRSTGGAVFIRREAGTTRTEDIRPVNELDRLLNAPSEGPVAAQQEAQPWYDNQGSSQGYLDQNEDPNSIFKAPSRDISSSPSTGNTVFRNPW